MFKPKIFEMIRKEILVLYRRKKNLALLIMLPLILGSLMALLPSLTSFNDVSVGLCDLDGSALSARFVSEMSSSFKTTSFNASRSFCEDELSRGVKQGAYTIGLIIEPGFSSNLENLKKSSITVFYDNSDFRFETYLDWFVYKGLNSFKAGVISEGERKLKSEVNDVNSLALSVQEVTTLAKNSISDPVISPLVDQAASKVDSFVSVTNIIKNLDVSFLSEPVIIHKSGVYDIKSPTTTAFPIVVGLLSVFTVFMIASTSVIFDKNNNYLVRIRTSKTLLINYLAAKSVVFIIIMALQFVVLFLLFLVFGASFKINFATLLITVGLFTVVNSMIGVVIGLLSENETVAILISLLLTLPFLFISGVFYPSEMFPKVIQTLGDIFPLKTGIWLIKASSVFGLPFGVVTKDLSNLVIYSLSLGFVAWFLLRFKNQ